MPGCAYCTSALHRPPRRVSEHDADGLACEWAPLDEVRQTTALHRFDRAFPTRRHWHHYVHSFFDLSCDELCRPSPAANHNAETPSLVHRIKQAYRIEDLVSRVTRLHGKGATLTGRCPLHAEKRGRAFVVWTELQKWRCYGKCGAGGDVIDFVRECESRGIDWRGRGAAANGGRGRH